jgi:hypothetical protein
MVECTFREVGCLAAVNPDEMAAHLDTQIHYHTSVSATPELCVAKSVSLLDSIQSVFFFFLIFSLGLHLFFQNLG